MDILEAILTRRSVRKFKDQPVSDEVIHKIIDAARFAPSAHNGQPWEFIITRDDEKKRKLNEGKTWTRFLPYTPVVIIVCAKFPEKSRKAPGEKGLQYMCVQDTAAAIENLLLAAHGLGLGTCWVGDFDDNTLRDMFSIPEEFAPVAIIALGYPDTLPPKAPRRKPVEDIIHWETF